MDTVSGLPDPKTLDTQQLRAELAKMRQEQLDLMEGTLDPVTGEKRIGEVDQAHLKELDARIHRFTLEYLERSNQQRHK